MSMIKTKDGTEIYYKNWGIGQPVIFSHGWPLSGDAWEGQMVFLASKGYRCIAHDRRGHGRSSQASEGNEMDTYADDLAELIEGLDLNITTLIGHSAGGGEVARYIGRHGTKGEPISKPVKLSESEIDIALPKLPGWKLIPFVRSSNSCCKVPKRRRWLSFEARRLSY